MSAFYSLARVRVRMRMGAFLCTRAHAHGILRERQGKMATGLSLDSRYRFTVPCIESSLSPN